MTWIALKSIAERRMRAALTALAIVLGVAMIAGSQSNQVCDRSPNKPTSNVQFDQRLRPTPTLNSSVSSRVSR